MRNFSEWLSGLRDSIADYGYYIDFEKVHRNVDNIKVELNILNSLIGSKNIETDFENLMRKYPEVLKCIPLLLAVRANEIYCQDENGGHLFQFDFGKYPPNSHLHYERYKYFMRETGVFDLLKNNCTVHKISYSNRYVDEAGCLKNIRVVWQQVFDIILLMILLLLLGDCFCW